MKLQTSCQWLIVILSAGMMLNIFVPETSFQNVGYSQIAFYCLSSALFIAVSAIYLVVQRPGFAWRISLTDLAMFAFIGFIAANYYLKRPFRNDYLVAIIVSGLNYLIFRLLMCNDGLRGKFRASFPWMLSAVFMWELLAGAGQLLGWDDSFRHGYIRGHFINSSIYGIFVALAFNVSLVMLYFGNKENGNRRLMYPGGILLITALFLLPATNARVAWLVAALGLVVLYFCFSSQSPLHRGKHRNIWLASLGIGLLVAICVLFYYKKDSSGGRLLIWKVSTGFLRSNPVTGVGFNQFKHAYLSQQQGYFQEKPRSAAEILVADKNDYAFNDYLQIAAENGLAGLLLFVALLAAVLKGFRRKDADAAAWAGLMGMISILACSWVSYPLQIIAFWHFFLLFVVMTGPGTALSWQIRSPAAKLIALPCLGAMLFICKAQFSEKEDRQKWEYAARLLNDGDAETAAAYFREAYQNMPYEKCILPGYGKSLLLMRQFDQSQQLLEEAGRYISDPFIAINLAEIYAQKGAYGQAEAAYLQAVHMIPNRIYPRYLLFKLYIRKNDMPNAKRMALQIRELKVKVKSPAIEQMLADINKYGI